MNLQIAKFSFGAIGLIAITIVTLIFIWYGKDVSVMSYFALAFAFIASSSDIKDIKDLVN